MEAKVALSLLLIPTERTHPCERTLNLVFVIRHSDPPPDGGFDTIVSTAGSLLTDSKRYPGAHLRAASTVPR